jgi:hypothetical protein
MIAQIADRRQITGPPFITCVDLDGHQVPATELWYGPAEAIDPTHPACWPAWTDNHFWELDDQVEADALMDAEAERQADLWHAMMTAGSLPAVSGGAPEPCEPTAEDLADYEAWSRTLEVRRWLDSNPPFSAWLESQGGDRRP